MNKTIIKQFAVCLISGLAAFLVLVSIAALVLLKFPVSQSSYYAIAFTISVICATLTSFINTRITKQKGIIIGSTTALLFDLFLAVLLLIAGAESLSGKFFVLAAVNFVAGTAAGIYAANLKRKR